MRGVVARRIVERWLSKEVLFERSKSRNKTKQKNKKKKLQLCHLQLLNFFSFQAEDSGILYFVLNGVRYDDPNFPADVGDGPARLSVVIDTMKLVHYSGI